MRDKTAVVLLILFMLQALAPMASATEARNTTPDFAIQSLGVERNSGDIVGSVLADDGEIYLGPGDHVVKVIVKNHGADGIATLRITLQSAPGAAETEISTVNLGTITQGTSTNPALIDITVAGGADQVIKATVTGTSDSNPSNNAAQIDFDCSSYRDIAYTDFTKPEPLIGDTVARIDASGATVSANVMNSGVIPVTATLKVTLDAGTGDPSDNIILSSNSEVLQPGSLSTPVSTATALTANIPGSYTGEYTMSAEIEHVSSEGTSTITMEDSSSATTWDVKFSNYIATLITPGDRTIQPGMSSTLTFIIRNYGASDTFNIGAGSTGTWADTASVAASVSVAQDATEHVTIDVTVPAGAALSVTESITLTLTSTGDSYALVGTVAVMSGESYSATITPPAGPTPQLVPSQTTDLLFTLENTGNSPSAFMLTTGNTVGAVGWSIIPSVGTTDLVAAGDTREISVAVTPPAIEDPIPANTYVRAGDALGIYLQAVPVLGGMPAMGSKGVEIKPVIAVDPGLPTESITISSTELIDTNGTTGWGDILTLDVAVRHNLVADLTETFDVGIAVDSLTFTPTTSGGAAEASRWTAQVTPATLTGITPDTSGVATLGIQGPTDEYPMAGLLNVSVTVTPDISGNAVLSGQGVEIAAVTRILTLTVEPVVDAEILTTGPLVATAGEGTDFSIDLANIGNTVSNYKVSVINDLPANWSWSIASKTEAYEITNVPPSMANHPTQGTEHVKQFTLNITTDAQTPASSAYYATIQIQNADTNEVISTTDVPITVTENIDVRLTPPVNDVTAEVGDSLITRVFLHNNGNTPATYTISLDDSEAKDVVFELISESEVTVAPGSKGDAQIKLTPNATATADDIHKLTVLASTTSGITRSAVINVGIGENHLIGISIPDKVDVVPGSTKTIDVEVVNTGNLQQTIYLSATVEDDWMAAFNVETLILDVDEVNIVQLTIEVPSLGSDGTGLEDGAMKTLTISAANSTEGGAAVVGSKSTVLSVGALFILEYEGWQSEFNFHQSWQQNVEVIVTNVGNSDVEVNVDIGIFITGQSTESSDWEVMAGAPTSLTLPVNTPVNLEFSLLQTGPNPALSDRADLKVTFTPSDAAIEGEAELSAILGMKGFFVYEDIVLQSVEGGGFVEREIIYSHIPVLTQEDNVIYQIEMCQADRRIDLAAMSLDPALYTWKIELVASSSNVVELNLTKTWCNGDNKITLPPRNSWVTSDPITLRITPPSGSFVLPDDGYNLTMRLFHPDGSSADEVFEVYLEDYSNPSLSEITLSDDLVEGETGTARVTLTNHGSALAIMMTTTLTCDGLDVEGGEMETIMLNATDSVTLEWTVSAPTLDWWESARDVDCTAEVVSSFESSKWKSDNVVNQKLSVESWSPGISISFIACIVFLAGGFMLVRMGRQNEKLRLAGAYSSTIALGFAFHLIDAVWWGPLMLITAAFVVWRIAWKASDEFQFIHEDYQRARVGATTIYSDHIAALDSTKKQLVLILGVPPVLGFLAVSLGMPPTFNMDPINAGSLMIFMIAVMVGVIMLVGKADKAYGTLYGRLTDAEVKAKRLERDMGDPANLLREIAFDRIDLEPLLAEPEPLPLDAGLEEPVEDEEDEDASDEEDEDLEEDHEEEEVDDVEIGDDDSDEEEEEDIPEMIELSTIEEEESEEDGIEFDIVEDKEVSE